jgi:hypothetical protein
LVLKRHAEPESAHDLPEATSAVAGLGFDETVVGVPWAHGIDESCTILAACGDAARMSEASLSDTVR